VEIEIMTTETNIQAANDPGPWLDFEEQAVLFFACKLHEEFGICDHGQTFKALAEKKIDEEHLLIEFYPERDCSRLNKLRRIRDRLVAMAAAAASFIEDVEYLLGVDVHDYWRWKYEQQEATSKKDCVICEKPIIDQPYNAEPVAQGECCGRCSDEYVVHARAAKIVTKPDSEVRS
jgi:hypothetical protein